MFIQPTARNKDTRNANLPLTGPGIAGATIPPAGLAGAAPPRSGTASSSSEFRQPESARQDLAGANTRARGRAVHGPVLTPLARAASRITMVLALSASGAAGLAHSSISSSLSSPLHSPSPSASPASSSASSRATAPGASPSWEDTVRRQIVDSEYEITWQDRTVLADLDAAWQAPNRANGLRTYFTESGIRVVPRSDEPPAWEWSLRLVAWG